MKVLMISTDRNVFSPASAVRERLSKLASQVEELTIIVFSLQEDNLQPTNDRQLKLIPTQSQSKLFYHWDAIRLGKTLSRPELITTQDPFLTGFVGLRLKKFFKVKLELQLHTDAFSPHFRQFSTQNYFYYKLAKFLLPQAERVRVVSRQIKESLLAANLKLQTEPQIIPIYVDVDKLKNSSPVFNLHERYSQFKKIVLMSCRLEKEKDLPLALRVFKKVLATQPNLGLVIIGDGSEREALKELARELKIEHQVIFAGWQLDLASYYYGADVFLQTSRYEGYGLALAEAATVGLPIVSTPVGIATDLSVAHLGKNEEELVEALLASLNNVPGPQSATIPKVSTSEYYQQIVNAWQKLI